MRNKSFTLIELLVVIVIIGILAGVIMVSTSSSIDKANIAKINVFASSLRNDLLMNVVQEWRFDEGSGSVAKEFQSGSSASLINFPSTVASYGDNGSPGWLSEKYCVSGTCMNFDGVINAYIDTPNTTLLPLFTLSTWVYNKSGGNGSHAILRHYWEVVQENIRFWSFCFGPTCSSDGLGDEYWRTSTGSKIKYDKWTHITTIWDGTYVTHYINGEFDWRDSNASFGTSEALSYIAGYSDRIMKGRLDELIIYDKNLSLSEIKQNYIAGLDSLLAQGGISKEEYNQRINKLAYEE